MTEASADTGMRPRELAPGQRTCVWVAGTDSAPPRLVHETSHLLLEAPNFGPDGRSLLLNGAGRLWRLELGDGRAAEPKEVPLHGVPPINNDHVVSPDGRHVYLSGMDGHLYRAPLSGGAGTRLTGEDGSLHFLHGIGPDGGTLAYVAIPRGTGGGPGRLALMPAEGGPGRLVDTGDGHLDGPEYAPDGRWILFNSEAFTTAPGHAQIVRMPAGGGPLERLVDSETVDWFPHLSPDGRFATYLSFPAGTLGHPADLDVTVHLVSTEDWRTPLRSFPLFGGQGTLNVNGWSPDSSRFAFVSYPVS
ncbi:TolB family protein [Phaeacidiphilus oryzae]|uniref:TolB family protein n=1 Tax=Phaeacidiphilus oryzae TaxID=348818 RepID=UPI000A466C6D|nr:PD40 domain-containing protein [Phaeacidiphilus oryzae]